MLADFRRADQDLKRPAEPAPLAGHDYVMRAPLRRCHLGDGNLAITAHSCAPRLFGVGMLGKPCCDRCWWICFGWARLRRINPAESGLSLRNVMLYGTTRIAGDHS